jgi:hypothetical protein
LALILAMGLLGLTAAAAGCSDCVASCTGWEESDVTRLNGTFLGRVDEQDALRLRFDTVERAFARPRLIGLRVRRVPV